MWTGSCITWYNGTGRIWDETKHRAWHKVYMLTIFWMFYICVWEGWVRAGQIFQKHWEFQESYPSTSNTHFYFFIYFLVLFCIGVSRRDSGIPHHERGKKKKEGEKAMPGSSSSLWMWPYFVPTQPLHVCIEEILGDIFIVLTFIRSWCLCLLEDLWWSGKETEGHMDHILFTIH